MCFSGFDRSLNGTVARDLWPKLIDNFNKFLSTAFSSNVSAEMFDSMDLKHAGVLTFDEWYRFSMEQLTNVVVRLEKPTAILEQGEEEEYIQVLI